MLELRDLARRYGDVVALDGISFTVSESQTFGFVGPNGAGKTTAMRVVLGVLSADRGEVLFRGRPVDFAMRSRFGYMPEERGLYPKLRIGDQLIYLVRLHGVPAGEAERAADRWIERLGLTERAGDRVEALSLGNQQRVQLAAALVHDPELLVAGRAVLRPGPGRRRRAQRRPRRLRRDRVPVIFSSHQLELVERLCEAVAIIKDGRWWRPGPWRSCATARPTAGTCGWPWTRRATTGWPPRRAPRWSTAARVARSWRYPTASRPTRRLLPGLRRPRVAGRHARAHHGLHPERRADDRAARIVTGDVPAWEIAASLLVTLGSAVALIPLAARIYSGGILRTGSALKLREAWKAARA